MPASRPAPPAPAPAPAAAPKGPAAGAFPTREELTIAWGDVVLGRLSQRARARFRSGRFTGVEGETALFALPDRFHRDRCREVQAEVEQALNAHFGRPVRLRLVVDTEARPSGAEGPGVDPGPPPPDEEAVVWEELQDAPPGAVASPIEHVLQVFEGAEVVEE